MTQINKQANPQGKGIVGVVTDLRQQISRHVAAKDHSQILADYFTSSLVLIAQYSFKPVMGVAYYLYFREGKWSLSLIEPEAWTSSPGLFFARCQLNEDRTWCLQTIADWQSSSLLAAEIERLQSDFIASLNNDHTFLEQLPFYQSNLNYFQRLGAYALAHSLQCSLLNQYGQQHSTTLSARQLLLSGLKHNKLLLNNLAHNSNS